MHSVDEPRATVDRPPAAGGGESFEALYRQSSGRVLGLCLRLLGSRPEAEDAAGEAYLKACRAHSSFDHSRPFARWILTIAGRVCVDRLRRRTLERKWFPADAADLPEPRAAEPGPLARLLSAERQRLLRQRIADLPERYRLVLALRYYAELTYAEIAALLDIERNHVAILLYRAKRRLRAALEAGAPEACP